jgi:flagellar hook-length control protein FliK
MSDLAFALNASPPPASSASQPRRAEAVDDNDAFRAELAKADRPSAADADRRRADIQRPAERASVDVTETSSVQEQPEVDPASDPDPNAAQSPPEKCEPQQPSVIGPENEPPKTDAATSHKTDAAVPLEILVVQPGVAATPTPIVAELPAPDAAPPAPAEAEKLAVNPDAPTQPAFVAAPNALEKEPKVAVAADVLPQPAPATPSTQAMASNTAPAISLDPTLTPTTPPAVEFGAPTSPAITQNVDANQVAPPLLIPALTSAVTPRPSGNATTPTLPPAASDDSIDAAATIAKPLAAHTSAPGGAITLAPRPDGGAGGAPAQSAFVVPHANADDSAAPAPAVKGAAPEIVLSGELAAPAQAAPASTPNVAPGALAAHSSLPPPPTIIQVQVGAPRLTIPAEALAYEIKRHQSNGINRFEIRLEPAELGRIDVRLEVAEDGTTRAHLSADRPETLDLLQRDSRQLERALQSLGLRTDRDALAFSLRQDSGAQGGDNRPGRDGQDRPATGAGAFAPFEEEMPAALAAAMDRTDSMRINIVI